MGKARVCCFPRLDLSSVIADGASGFFVWQRRSADDIRASDALLSHWNLLPAFCSSLVRWDSLLVFEHLRAARLNSPNDAITFESIRKSSFDDCLEWIRHTKSMVFISIVTFSHSIPSLTSTEIDRDRRWSTSSGLIEPRWSVVARTDWESKSPPSLKRMMIKSSLSVLFDLESRVISLCQLHHLSLPCWFYTEFQVICRQSHQLISLNILLIYLHPRLSILVSGKSKNRVEIICWSNPVASSSGTISSIVSMVMCSRDFSCLWTVLPSTNVCPISPKFNLWSWITPNGRWRRLLNCSKNRWSMSTLSVWTGTIPVDTMAFSPPSLHHRFAHWNEDAIFRSWNLLLGEKS